MKPELNRRKFLQTSALTGAMVLAACGQAGTNESGSVPFAEKSLAGTWKMVDYFFETTDGQRLYPWGQKPIGLLVIDGKGWLSAQGMHDKDRTMSQPPTQEQQARAFQTYSAYYGNYRVDAAQKILTTRVVGALDPSWVGSDQVRHFSFEGTRLVLRTNLMKLDSTTQAVGNFYWERS